MKLLEALAAFALTMLLFSTIITAIVEVVLNRILKLRQRGFRRLLARVYDDVLAPKFERELEGLRSAGYDPRKEFLDSVARNPGVVGPPEKGAAETGGRLDKIARKGKEAAKRSGSMFASHYVSALNAAEFAERLADTEIGKLIAREARARRDLLIDDVALKFERFGAGTFEYFSQRARTLSIAVAIV